MQGLVSNFILRTLNIFEPQTDEGARRLKKLNLKKQMSVGEISSWPSNCLQSGVVHMSDACGPPYGMEILPKCWWFFEELHRAHSGRKMKHKANIRAVCWPTMLN